MYSKPMYLCIVRRGIWYGMDTYDTLLWWRGNDSAPVLVPPHQLLVQAQEVAVASDDTEAAAPETLEIGPADIRGPEGSTSFCLCKLSGVTNEESSTLEN